MILPPEGHPGFAGTGGVRQLTHPVNQHRLGIGIRLNKITEILDAGEPDNLIAAGLRCDDVDFTTDGDAAAIGSSRKLSVCLDDV